jgi:hypothetical protein
VVRQQQRRVEPGGRGAPFLVVEPHGG